MNAKDFRWWGMVAKDGSHIREVRHGDKEVAEAVMTDGWTERLKALYEIKPVNVSVETTEQKN